MNQAIIPHLWFDTQAIEAAEFYVSVFPESKVTHRSTLHNTPSGDCDLVSFDLWGLSFMAISAGPLFTFNPSISFMVNFDPSTDPEASSRLDTIWNQLLDGGKVLMPLDAYPFSKRYGWVQDKYGLSWQLILTDPAGDERPAIIPSLMFVGDQCGKAEEASDFYLSVFSGRGGSASAQPDSARGQLARYPAGSEPDAAGTVMFTDFKLRGQWLAAMDSAQQHDFAFNEAISLLVECEDQAEIDYYWEQLSAVPQAEQCGWLKDTYGVSWQIVPKQMNEMMRTGTREQIDRMTQVFLPMKKFDIAILQQAYQGK